VDPNFAQLREGFAFLFSFLSAGHHTFHHICGMEACGLVYNVSLALEGNQGVNAQVSAFLRGGGGAGFAGPVVRNQRDTRQVPVSNTEPSTESINSSVRFPVGCRLLLCLHPQRDVQGCH
jgi:hypothetical protein